MKIWSKLSDFVCNFADLLFRFHNWILIEFARSLERSNYILYVYNPFVVWLIVSCIPSAMIQSEF